MGKGRGEQSRSETGWAEACARVCEDRETERGRTNWKGMLDGTFGQLIVSLIELINRANEALSTCIHEVRGRMNTWGYLCTQRNMFTSAFLSP